MPTSTYTPLANITLGSAAASVTFSSISGSYRDLILVVNGTTSGTGDLYLRCNSDSGSNYAWVAMFGNGSTTTSNSGTQTYLPIGFAGSTNPMNYIVNIMDYSATDKHKTSISRFNQADTYVMSYASRWANTSAITSVFVSSNSGNWTSGSSFALYGIAS